MGVFCDQCNSVLEPYSMFVIHLCPKCNTDIRTIMKTLTEKGVQVKVIQPSILPVEGSENVFEIKKACRIIVTNEQKKEDENEPNPPAN